MVLVLLRFGFRAGDCSDGDHDKARGHRVILRCQGGQSALLCHSSDQPPRVVGYNEEEDSGEGQPEGQGHGGLPVAHEVQVPCLVVSDGGQRAPQPAPADSVRDVEEKSAYRKNGDCDGEGAQADVLDG
jgi:hypothetical protein